MQLTMNDERLQTIEQVKQFLAGSKPVDFGGVSVEQRYQWIRTVLLRFKYYQLERAEKCLYQLAEAVFFCVAVTDHRDKVKKTHQYQDVIRNP
jgi:hypothetical protein